MGRFESVLLGKTESQLLASKVLKDIDIADPNRPSMGIELTGEAFYPFQKGMFRLEKPLHFPRALSAHIGHREPLEDFGHAEESRGGAHGKE
jgi:hypothetical protein